MKTKNVLIVGLIFVVIRSLIGIVKMIRHGVPPSIQTSSEWNTHMALLSDMTESPSGCAPMVTVLDGGQERSLQTENWSRGLVALPTIYDNLECREISNSDWSY